jgi:hypothetical protein
MLLWFDPFPVKKPVSWKLVLGQIGFLLSVVILAAAILHQLPPDWNSGLVISCYCLVLVSFVFRIGQYIWHTHQAGQVLVELGAGDKAGWPVFIGLVGTLLFTGSLVEDFSQNDVDVWDVLPSACAACACAYLSFIGLSKLRLTSRGVLAAPDFIRWDQIESYEWEVESQPVLVLQIKYPFGLRHSKRLRVPMGQQTVVQQRLFQMAKPIVA